MGYKGKGKTSWLEEDCLVCKFCGSGTLSTARAAPGTEQVLGKYFWNT